MNPLTRLLRPPALALLLWAITAYTVRAAPDPPPWRQNLTCQPAIQKYRGVEYCTGLAGQAHVIVVDLRSSGVRLQYVIAQGVDGDCPLDAKCTPDECRDVNRSTKKLPEPRGPGCDDPNNRATTPSCR